MSQSQPNADLWRSSDPKSITLGLASGAKLVNVEDDPGGRLVFVLSGLPKDFMTRIANDEIRVSARAVLLAWEMVMGRIAENQRTRRAGR